MKRIQVRTKSYVCLESFEQFISHPPVEAFAIAALFARYVAYEDSKVVDAFHLDFDVPAMSIPALLDRLLGALFGLYSLETALIDVAFVKVDQEATDTGLNRA